MVKFATALRVSGLGVLLLGLMLWVYGGAQKGLFKDSYVVTHFDEITEIEYPVKVDAFLPGIETLAAGFFLFAALVTLSSFLDSRKMES